MLSEEEMKGVMQKYLDGFNQNDAKLIISLFAEDGQIEDPVGRGIVANGKDEIFEFYQRIIKFITKMELDTPIRGSHGSYAAMAFTLHIEQDGKKTTIQVIDVMEFNNAGEIIEMKAHHGPSDVSDL